MDQAGHRIPAWKRLGLKLKAANQSGDAAAPGPNLPNDNGSSQNQNVKLGGEPHVEVKGAREENHLVLPAENGKSSSLGKRKHQGPAEEQYKSPKKSKAQENHPATNGEATESTHAPPIEAPIASASVDADHHTEPPSDKPRPKGDPNYRKKKGKQNKVHSRQQEDQSAESSGSLLPSTETDFQQSRSLTTPKPSKHTAPYFTRDSLSASSPPRTDRRKSVTFTPDTKTVDGDSASNFFKKWVVEQKSADATFSAAEVAQFVPPPKSHPANGISASPHSVSSKETHKAKRSKNQSKLDKELSPTNPTEAVSRSSVPASNLKTSPKNKNKDTPDYTSYLEQYYFDRQNWKFNKAKQNNVITNAFNIYRIPHKYTEALTEYIRGLKGAATVDRLKEKCEEVKKELDEEDHKAMGTMTDADEREIARLEALEDRIAQGWRRRQTNGDLEDLASHPHPEGFIRRLKRRRVEALCEALKMAVPNAPPREEKPNGKPTSLEANTGALLAAQARNSRKRKSRTEVSSDESSSSESSESSSEEESSSSSDESGSDESEDDSQSDEDDSGSESNDDDDDSD